MGNGGEGIFAHLFQSRSRKRGTRVEEAFARKGRVGSEGGSGTKLLFIWEWGLELSGIFMKRSNWDRVFMHLPNPGPSVEIGRGEGEEEEVGVQNETNASSLRVEEISRCEREGMKVPFFRLFGPDCIFASG